MAAKTKKGRPPKKAKEKFRVLRITVPPELERAARRAESISGYFQDLYKKQQEEQRA